MLENGVGSQVSRFEPGIRNMFIINGHPFSWSLRGGEGKMGAPTGREVLSSTVPPWHIVQQEVRQDPMGPLSSEGKDAFVS